MFQVDPNDGSLIQMDVSSIPNLKEFPKMKEKEELLRSLVETADGKKYKWTKMDLEKFKAAASKVRKKTQNILIATKNSIRSGTGLGLSPWDLTQSWAPNKKDLGSNKPRRDFELSPWGFLKRPSRPVKLSRQSFKEIMM